MTADHASCLLALLHWPRFIWRDSSWFYSDRNVFIAQLLFYSSIVIIHFIDLCSLFYADNTWFVFSFVKLSFHLSVPQFCVFYNVIVNFWRVYAVQYTRRVYAVQYTRRGTLWQWRWHELKCFATTSRTWDIVLLYITNEQPNDSTRLDWTDERL